MCPADDRQGHEAENAEQQPVHVEPPGAVPIHNLQILFCQRPPDVNDKQNRNEKPAQQNTAVAGPDLLECLLQCRHAEIIAVPSTGSNGIQVSKLKDFPIGYKSPCFFDSHPLKWTICGAFDGYWIGCIFCLEVLSFAKPNFTTILAVLALFSVFTQTIRGEVE